MFLFVAMHTPRGPEGAAAFMKSLPKLGNAERRYPGHVSYAFGRDE